jgi:hypothetical protein
MAGSGRGFAPPLMPSVVIVGAITYALGWRPQFNQIGPAQTSQTPLEILNARSERGEIIHEEHKQVRLGLEG